MPRIAVDAFLAAVVVLRETQRGVETLLMRRRFTPAGTWSQVAGKLRAGETAWQAGLRELREETGLTPISFHSTDTCERYYEPDRDAITLAPVFVAYVAADAEPVLNEEHDAHRWCDLDTAIGLVSFGGQRRAFREIREDFVDHAPAAHHRIELPQ